jgi:uncharacterized protein YndB with AHSA1/START domain
MNNVSSDTTNSEVKRDLVFTRIFDAPVERVWRAWSESEQVMRWWGPQGFTCPLARINFREGGTSLVCMRAPKEFGGQDVYNTWTYEEIAPLERLVYTLRFSDADGNVVDPVELGLSPDMPGAVLNEVILKRLGNGKTELTVTEYDWTVGQLMEMSRMGMEQCLDKMAASFED